MAEIYNEFNYQTRMGRQHSSNYDIDRPHTYGCYCPYCGYKLYFTQQSGYYCECSEWINKCQIYKQS